MGAGGFFLEVRGLRRETHHTLIFGDEIKKTELYRHSPIRLHGVVVNELIKDRICFPDYRVFGFMHPLNRSRDSVVGTTTGYGLDDREVGVRVPVGSRIFSSPRRPDRLWSPPNLLSNAYRGFFPRE
jgi:hypothetical protein